jgi:hypothetical protein
MVPEGESPLLLPANKHKQLVVIDFEYANANLPGLEFANHFVSLAILIVIVSRFLHPALNRRCVSRLTATPDRVDVQLP